jgi:lambda repressor-like predicted transcriptional regulator
MKPYEIKAALTAKNIKLSDLATEIGVSRPVITQVISGSKVSARVRAEIAGKIGKTVSDIWPARP